MNVNNKKVLDFIGKHRISVLSTVQDDGKPYSATLHYANSVKPLQFLFITEKTSKKCQPLKDEKLHPASLVVGFSEEEFITLQMQGNIQIVSNSKKLQKSWNAYTEKYPQATKRKIDPNFVILSFTLNWWKYTELKPSPPTIISSE